jgi:hypothetical protein
MNGGSSEIMYGGKDYASFVAFDELAFAVFDSDGEEVSFDRLKIQSTVELTTGIIWEAGFEGYLGAADINAKDITISISLKEGG